MEVSARWQAAEFLFARIAAVSWWPWAPAAGAALAGELTALAAGMGHDHDHQARPSAPTRPAQPPPGSRPREEHLMAAHLAALASAIRGIFTAVLALAAYTLWRGYRTRDLRSHTKQDWANLPQMVHEAGE